MRVARIYTRVPEESSELVERLRARGYTVELVEPADFRVTPADLEIRLDRMKPAEAFAAAAEFVRQQRSGQNGVEVFVADGTVVDEGALRAARGESVERGNVVVDGLKQLIAPFRRAGREVHMSRAGRRQQVIEREAALESAREAERQQRIETKVAARAERERQEVTASAEREQREIAARAQREEEARRESERKAEREAVLAREREAVLARERDEDARRQEEEALRRAERAAILAREREEEARAERDRQEAARRMEAEAEQRRQHAEAAAALIAEQEAAARAERENIVPVAAEVAAVPLAPVSPEPRDVMAARRPRLRLSPSRNAPRQMEGKEGSRVMKRTFVAAACIAILAAIGWGAYENRTPASPLSNAERVRGSSIQQDVPFGSARINGQANAARPAAKPQNAPVTKPAQSAQAAQQPAAAKPAGSKPAAGTPKRGGGVIAEDQVIYHGAPKKSTNRAAAQPPPVKKISDMD